MEKKIVSLIDEEIKTLEAKRSLLVKEADDKAKAQREKEALESRSEIDSIVNEFNVIAQEQGERLKQLFLLMKQRSGYRRLDFSNGDMWSDWSLPDRLFKTPVTSIVKVTLGE